MNEQPVQTGHHQQEALTPKEFLIWVIGRLSTLLATQWPLAIQRLQQLTGRSLLQLPAGARAGYLPGDDPWDLDRPILMLGPDDPFTLRMAFEGILALGSIGSGKSSGSLATFARAMLAQGFGMLILTSTPEEVEEWREWTRQTGREEDYIVVEPYGEEYPHQFNVLQYESEAHGSGGFMAENLVTLATQINTIVEGSRKQGGNNNEFFQQAMKELLRATLTAITHARYDVSLDNIRKLIATAPQTVEETLQQENGVNIWPDLSFCGEVLEKAVINALDGTEQQRHDVAMAERYWTVEYPRLHEKTRTSITATVTGNIDVLMYGIAHHMLATETTITPDAILKDGKIVCLNVPIQTFNETAIVLQGIWLYALQRAALRRDTAKYPHGVAIVADEAHYHLSEYTATFQSVARRARVCSFYLTQNYSQIVDRFGGNEAKAHSLLGNFVTKIFHAQSDAESNRYASDLIGQHWDFRSNTGTTTHGMDPVMNTSAGLSEQLVAKILPSSFTTLRKGGPGSNFEVDAILYQGGRIFNATGDTWMPIIFRQITG